MTPLVRALLWGQAARENENHEKNNNHDNDDENNNENNNDENNNNNENNQQQHHQQQQQHIDNQPQQQSDDQTHPRPQPSATIIRINAIGAQGMKRTQFVLLDGTKSMNALFGDPCPGISKRLLVNYSVSEGPSQNNNNKYEQEENRGSMISMSFAEHEKVILRRHDLSLHPKNEPLPQVVVAAAAAAATATSARDADNVTTTTTNNTTNNTITTTITDDKDTRQRRQLLERMTETTQERTDRSMQSLTLAVPGPSLSPAQQPKWQLPSSVSETVLPIVMPFLPVKERVQCQQVGHMWRKIIRDWGVATIIDRNDPAFPWFNRTVLRGLLQHSYHSLQSLFLSGLEDLQQSDLHPAIPHLRKLRSLDISRCLQLDDSTLKLLSHHVSSTMEVLYMKGLRRVTDEGIISICTSCAKLRVIEISYIPITDRAGAAIGHHLINLQALYMRDNYQLTNASIDVITERCEQLEQLTLWGCTPLRSLSFAEMNHGTLGTSNLSGGNLVMLNLWGCHNLQNDTAHALEGMTNLRSLIVSECHRLSDEFLVGGLYLSLLPWNSVNCQIG